MALEISSSIDSTKPYKLILSLDEIKVLNSKTLKDISLIIEAESSKKTLKFPFKEVFSFELEATTKDISVEILHKQQLVALGNLIIPEKLNENYEIETTEKLSTRVKLDKNNTEEEEIITVFNLNF